MDQAKRTLNFIIGAFAIGAVALVGVLSAVEIDDPSDPDLAGGATMTAAIFGGFGLLLALIWVVRAGERHRGPNRLLTAIIVRVAVAELGLLMGILGLLMTGSMTASYIGLGLFLASLALLGAGLRRVF